MATSYFVRIQGRVLGPFGPDQIKAMRSKGQLHKFHEISVDKENWYPASDFADLFPDSGSSGQRTTAPPSTSDEPSSPATAWHPRGRTNANSMVLVVTISAAVLILAGAGAGIWMWQKEKGKPVVTGPESETSKSISSLDEEDLARAIGLVACGLEVTGPDGDRWVEGLGTGSCFAISPKGHLVTNKHVIEEVWKLKRAPIIKKIMNEKSMEIVPKVWVFLNKKKYEASILHVSDDFDLGILKIESETSFYFRMSSSDKIQRTTKVVACGFPGAARSALSEEEVMRDLGAKKLGVDRKKRIDDYFKPRDLVFSASSGSVGRMEKEELGRVWIQHDASINPGNSGGPLIDSGGTVVGINTLRSLKGTGIYWSLSLPQLKSEIDKVVPLAVWK